MTAMNPKPLFLLCGLMASVWILNTALLWLRAVASL